MISVAQVNRNDTISPEIQEVPLRPGFMFSLHLHCPHEPAHSTGACLIGVNLGQEEVFKEINMVSIIIREVSIVKSASIIICFWIIWSHVSTIEILLAICDSIGKFSSEDHNLLHPQPKDCQSIDSDEHQ